MDIVNKGGTNLKSKYSMISFIFAILATLFAISSLIGDFNIIVIICMLTCMSLFLFFNGLYYFEQAKKNDGKLWILASIFFMIAVMSAVVNLVIRS